MLSKKLEQVGLNEKEVKVYLACLELGETTIDRISKKSGIKRTTLYDIVDNLRDEGIIGSTIKLRKKYYFAIDPRDLLERIEQKKIVLSSVMPRLISLINVIDHRPKIQFFEGVEGMKEIHMDTLRYPGSPIYAWVTDEIYSVLDDEFIEYYLEKLIKNKIAIFAIAPNSVSMREYQSMDKKSLRETRIDKDSRFSTLVEIDLYGKKKVGIMAFKEKVGLIIESETIFTTLKSIFDSQWNKII